MLKRFIIGHEIGDGSLSRETSRQRTVPCLSVTEEDDTVVQPGISVICDRSKIDDRGCKGAPDFIVEVLSFSSDRHDRLTKMKLYRNAGVREYWIVDPQMKAVYAHILESGKYSINAYGDTEKAPVSILNGCVINLAEIFDKNA